MCKDCKCAKNKGPRPDVSEYLRLGLKSVLEDRLDLFHDLSSADLMEMFADDRDSLVLLLWKSDVTRSIVSSDWIRMLLTALDIQPATHEHELKLKLLQLLEDLEQLKAATADAPHSAKDDLKIAILERAINQLVREIGAELNRPAGVPPFIDMDVLYMYPELRIPCLNVVRNQPSREPSPRVMTIEQYDVRTKLFLADLFKATAELAKVGVIGALNWSWFQGEDTPPTEHQDSIRNIITNYFKDIDPRMVSRLIDTLEIECRNYGMTKTCGPTGLVLMVPWLLAAWSKFCGCKTVTISMQGNPYRTVIQPETVVYADIENVTGYAFIKRLEEMRVAFYSRIPKEFCTDGMRTVEIHF